VSGTISTLPALGGVRNALERAWGRVDKSLLRLQGRIDTPTYDRWLPWGFAVLHAILLIALVLARYQQLDHGLETAKFTQAAWQIGEDLKPVTTLSGGNILAEQASLIIYPLGLLTSVLPRVETLLIIKSVALSITMVPLWRLATRHGKLGIGATSTIVFAYSIYTYVHNMNVTDFAPAILAVPALMFAALAGFDHKRDDEREEEGPYGWKAMTVACVFALCCRSDLGLAIAGLGVLLLLERRRRVGLIAFGLGFGWFLAAMYGLQRGLGDGGYEFLAPYSAFGDTPHGVLGGIISNPVRFAQTVGTQANFQILVTLLAPVLFLPLTAPRFLMPAIPLYVLYMGADVPPGRLSEAAQSVPMTVFVFVATVFALKRTGRILVKRVRVERRIILALLVTAIVFFVRDSSTTPYTKPWDWGGRDQVDLALVQAVDAIPIDEPVRATDAALPLLSERLGVYALDFDVGKFDPADPTVPVPFIARLDRIIEVATTDVDWLIIDLGVDAVDATADNAETLGSRLGLLGWQLQQDLSGDRRIVVYRFTGIVGAVGAPQEESTDLLGFGSITDSGDEDG